MNDMHVENSHVQSTKVSVVPTERVSAPPPSPPEMASVFSANYRHPLRAIDLFAGCGGLSLGLHRAGHELVFSVEKDPMAFETFSANLLDSEAPYRTGEGWPNWMKKSSHDIHELLTDNATREQLEKLRGKIDLVCGGPPCQGFSVGGLRDGKDARNQLPRRYVEFVELVRPQFVLMENQ